MPDCPTCGTEVVYRRWFLNRDGLWCPCCYGWCKPVVAELQRREP